MIVMKDGASALEIQGVVDRLHEVGAEAHLSRGDFKTIIGAIGDREVISQVPLAALPGVEKVIAIMKPFKLVSREFHPGNTVVEVGGARWAPTSSSSSPAPARSRARSRCSPARGRPKTRAPIS